MVLPTCLSLDSKGTSSTESSPTPNIATKEYKLAIQSNSYNEIWSTINTNSDDILQPPRESIEFALSFAPPSTPTHLVSAYFDHSENTARLCLQLRHSLLQAQSLYAPLLDLLSLSDPLNLQIHHCQMASRVFLQFESLPNPFPPPESLRFDHICNSFSDLKLQADRRLQESRSSSLRRILLLCRVPVAFSAVAWPRKAARVKRKQLDATGKGSFVVDNDLRTISCLVAHLRSAIDDDKELVRVALEGGAERHIVQEVLKQLKKNNESLLDQIRDVEERICLCLNTVNRARNSLLGYIYRHQTQSNQSPLRQDEAYFRFLTCLK